MANFTHPKIIHVNTPPFPNSYTSEIYHFQDPTCQNFTIQKWYISKFLKFKIVHVTILPFFKIVHTSSYISKTLPVTTLPFPNSYTSEIYHFQDPTC